VLIDFRSALLCDRSAAPRICIVPSFDRELLLHATAGTLYTLPLQHLSSLRPRPMAMPIASALTSQHMALV
jgi:hypothetical protein